MGNKNAWVILNHNGKYLEAIKSRPDGSLGYNWTKEPGLVHIFYVEPTQKPLNTSIIPVELKKYFRIYLENGFPKTEKTDWQHAPGEWEYEDEEEVKKEMIRYNNEQIEKHREIIDKYLQINYELCV